MRLTALFLVFFVFAILSGAARFTSFAANYRLWMDVTFLLSSAAALALFIIILVRKFDAAAQRHLDELDRPPDP